MNNDGHSRRYWLVSSFNYHNLEVARERLIWGFWDKSRASKPGLVKKLENNWREFIGEYNRIHNGDIVFFQTKDNYKIYGFGIVRDRFYDETPIWPMEIEHNTAFFPWRISFHTIIISREGVVVHGVRKSKYIDGYGLASFSDSEAHWIRQSLNESLIKCGLSIMF